MKTAPPKRLFRVHRRAGAREAYVGPRPPLPAVEAWVAANRSRFKAGEVAEVEVLHEKNCIYPEGGECTCPGGPEIKVSGETPEAN